ncbi:RNA polymerase sigma factor [Streptomyces yangpuensis]|uniref:RNA polymerase sigma factor n=1 Tax=Streptomyces yangpuensis TaxID=1648182 RepID=UPI00365E3642
MSNRMGTSPQPAVGLPPHRTPPPIRGAGDVGVKQDTPNTADTADSLDDGLLAVRAAEGDEDAFAVLVRRHSSRMLALARHLLGSRTDAEDAVQDAFLSAWRRLPEFQHTASFATWMYRIVTNRCLSTLRRRTRPLSLDAIPEPAATGSDSSPPHVAEIDAATAALTAALQRLSPELRVCWVLRELHGLHYDEIAHVTGSSEQTVRGRLFRARRALTEAMRPWR